MRTRQPITRADIEAVRGVQTAEILKQLMERGLIRIAGEDDSLGRPYLYGTTRLFLEVFGLRSLNDLPMAERLRPAPAAPPSDDSEEEGDEQVSSEAGDTPRRVRPLRASETTDAESGDAESGADQDGGDQNAGDEQAEAA